MNLDPSQKRRRPRFPWFPTLFFAKEWPRSDLLSTLPIGVATDPIFTFIVQGLAAGNARRNPSLKIRLSARTRRDDARVAGHPETALVYLFDLIRDFPDVEEFQKIAARLLHECNDERALAAWLGISLRFPGAMDAFHSLMTLAYRNLGDIAARTILQARFPRIPDKLDQLLCYAEACDIVGASAQRRAAFDRLARMFAKRKDSWLVTASWLEEEVGLHRAAVGLIWRLAAGTGLARPINRERERLRAAIGDGERVEGPTLNSNAKASVRVLGMLFERIVSERRGTAAVRLQAAGPAVLLTGSLGVGGAERQLVNTAVGLTRADLAERKLENGVVLDPVTVVARSLRDRKDGAFYRGELETAGVEVHSYREWPDFAGALERSAVRPALSALGCLPWSTAEAVIKLTDRLKSMNPEVVHIWQDGLIYAAGLAAILAGVPRIVLSGRSTPPPDRRENYLVEYDIIYRSLLQAPGVSLSVNSRHAASRYAAWLGIDPRDIAVIPNGVAAAPCAADVASESLFGCFDARTGNSSLTLGAVMRLDEVKRPLLWIEAAAAVLGSIRNARVIVVGDGPFKARVQRRAVALGIAEQCLFVGRSTCVGYWLSKMNLLLLLSEHEGLPNTLIEAQLAGVPVITSPAGGAPETLIAGVTGIVTSPTPTPAEVAHLVSNLAAKPERLQAMGAAAQPWAFRTFPISRMLSNTMALYRATGNCASALSLATEEEAENTPRTLFTA